jgi:hypothetical protein
MAPDQLWSHASTLTWCVFGTLVGATLVLHALTSLVPAFMVQLHSVPWAFQVSRSVELRYQCVLYATFHRGLWSRVTHLSLAWDQLFWFTLFWALHPLAVVVALAVLFAQAAWIGDKRVAVVLTIAWCAVASLAWLVHHVLGAESPVVAAAVLSVGGVIRASGHLTEPVPPGLGERHRFRRLGELRPTWQLIVSPLVGLVSEFAAGLPHRLFVVQVVWLADRLGITSESVGSFPSHDDEARRVLAGGWRAGETTAWMSAETAVEPE